MTRAQKKCLVVSLCFHGVIMGAIVVSAAFRSDPPISPDQIMILIPSNVKMVDRAVRTGERNASPAKPTPPAGRPTPTPVNPTPTRPTPNHSPTHVAEQPNPARRNTPRAQEEPKVATTRKATEVAPKKHEITPTFDLPSSSSKTAKNSTAHPSSQPDAQADNSQRLKEIDEAFSNLNSSVNKKEGDSKQPSVPALDSGEAFLNYGTAIKNAYYREWIRPDETTRTFVALVKIVVARDGTVVSAEMTQPSGNAAVDRSVQRALNAVKTLPRFPEGTTDTQRSFTIRFNLEPDESAG